MKKVIISACLLGEFCRYDGGTKKVNAVVEAFKDYEIIPFCPEAPLFGTPRERIDAVEVDGTYKIITHETNKDVTKLLQDEINTFIQLHPKVDAIVLKSKSPSCGTNTTPIFNELKEHIRYASGIASKMFKENFSHLCIKDETDF